MIEKKKIDVFSEILENYEGRDKFLKLFTYTAKLATLFTKSPETTDKFCQFGSKMSECRVILRLMDDIPVLQATIAYGWGKQVSTRNRIFMFLDKKTFHTKSFFFYH